MLSTPGRGVFTLSLDFELAWGSRDLSDNIEPLLRLARVTREQVFHPLLELLESRGMSATWATVGHLFLPSARREAGRLHPQLTPPRHAWKPDWFAGVPEGDETSAPEFYARSLVQRLLQSGQEVGSHGFSHPIYGDPGCTEEAARADLAAARAAAADMGVTLRSFVFPRNVHGHLGLLREAGFTCWRPLEPAWYRRPGGPGSVVRLAHLADVARAACPAVVTPRVGDFGLVEYPASASFLPMEGVRRFIPMRQRVERCRRGLDRAAEEGKAFHLASHPHNLASHPRVMLAAFGAVLDHAARLRDAGRIEVLSMGAVADRLLATSIKSPAARASSAPSSAG
jgi:peptidoglycan/xylan/chitin deacetylase (PgdA/CDA1 family)